MLRMYHEVPAFTMVFTCDSCGKEFDTHKVVPKHWFIPNITRGEYFHLCPYCLKPFDQERKSKEWVAAFKGLQKD